MSLHALRDDWLMPMGPSLAVAPSAWPQALADIAGAIASRPSGIAAPAQARHERRSAAIATALQSGERKAVLLGSTASQHPEAATLERLGRWIAEQTGATFGWLVDGANTVGAQLVGARPAEAASMRDGCWAPTRR